MDQLVDILCETQAWQARQILPGTLASSAKFFNRHSAIGRFHDCRIEMEPRR